MRRTSTFVAALVLATAALAQSVPPALFARVEPKGKLQALRLSKLKADVRILGFLAETKMTLTFHNPHNRVLEGDLYFPLPEGSTVSGYALDIKGQMVDGVVVGKQKARQVYEKIVRQGIDPGLVEWVKGNNFKTRVFPIPARSTRTIRVDYVADLIEKDGAATYRLPMSHKAKLDQFDLRIEVVKGSAKPKVAEGGDGRLAFAKFRDSFIAESHAENATVDKDLVVALPEVGKQKVLVEKAPDGKVYFAINDCQLDPRNMAPRKAPKHIAVLWDASASRAKADHRREIGLLTSYVASLRAAEMSVMLIVFRNTPEEPKFLTIKNGDCSKLVAELEAVEYDGGTQIGSLRVVGLAEPYDIALLFSDGISNFGKETPDGITCPVYIFNGQATANHSFLRYLALKTGGEYFNLARLEDKAIVRNIGSAAFTFLRAVGSKGGDPKVGRPILPHERGVIAETYPRVTQPIHGRFTLVGMLAEGDVGQVRLHYGAGGQPFVHSTHLVRRADAVEGNLLQRYWAQRKVQDLSIFPKRNEQEITYVGKKHGIVTPHTSLIVLDSLPQYVEHQILPPKTLPKVRQQYIDIMEKRRVAHQKQEAGKLQRIVALWQQRVKWWETEFKYPPDFKYRAKETKRADRIIGQGGAPRPGVRPAAPAPARPAPDAAPPPAAEPEGERGVLARERSARLTETGRAPRKKNGKGTAARATAPAIVIKAWDPKTPYLAKLKAAKPDALFDVYLTQRNDYGTSPAFFLDCADFFVKQKKRRLALQALSNVAELELENAALVRVLAHKLAQLDELELATYLFEDARRLRPEEPQSYRDLALVLARRADGLRQLGKKAEAKALYERAVGLLAHVVMNKWDRFREIELIALMELNAILPRAKSVGLTDVPLDPRLVKLLDADVRIIMTWDADNTDMDLHVIEPSAEHAYYSHRRTVIGGNVSRDFTRGYGPEEYCLRKAMRGMYTIKTKYFGSAAARLLGAVTLQLDIFTNYGRPNQQRKSITLRLTEKKEMLTVGQIEF